MTKRNRLLVFLLICVMLGTGVLMIFKGLKPNYQPDMVAKKVDYTYRDFAAKHADIKDGVIVLAYHRILKDNQVVNFAQRVSKNPQLQEYNVSQAVFNAQMAWLKQERISVWSSDELLAHIKANDIKGKHVVITFDDIDTTLPRNAANVLFEKQFPFTFFVITGQVGKNLDGEQLASWPEIEKLSQRHGVTVGLHTNDLHYQVNNQPVLATHQVSQRDIIKDYKQSRTKIKAQLNRQPNVFAYPYGRANKTLTRYMMTHGVKGIYLLEPGIVTNDAQHIQQQIPRFIITDQNFKQLQDWLVMK
ncbi:polysaccharide deacetylase family protein [Leuconostoc holzapfelii]|uniref:Polysaccharide deacetylase family protein n=1 Tax=Leuconostoc holzapfelii TaxID=434464 RepID=A0A846ZIH1_9LACO|nr:polysaccharide deacetylase family protein [Leuconostoc holzapfelii]NKZ18733.1 polysaccharide deacetylase family protein [Leuconostoc holzapfelii]